MTTTPNTTPDSLRSCPPAARRARVERKTKESDIVVELDLDGTGRISIDTGVPFFDHMLTLLAGHAVLLGPADLVFLAPFLVGVAGVASAELAVLLDREKVPAESRRRWLTQA